MKSPHPGDLSFLFGLFISEIFRNKKAALAGAAPKIKKMKYNKSNAKISFCTPGNFCAHAYGDAAIILALALSGVFMYCYFKGLRK